MKRSIFILGLLWLMVPDLHSQFLQSVTSSDGRFLHKRIEKPLLGLEQIKKAVSADTVFFND